MPKMYHRELSFQSGEISPRYNGRSNTDVYDKGLAIAENVLIDKHGGAFKRDGLFHLGRIVGDMARVFTLQVDRIKFYTLILHKHPTIVNTTELIIIAPGAQLLGSNLMFNSGFLQGETGWIKVVDPSTSRVEFSTGRADLVPEQNDIELVSDPTFALELTDWIVRETGSSVVSTNPGQITLTPQPVAGRIAGIAQEITTGSINQAHNLTVNGAFNSEAHVLVGLTEGSGEFLDTTISQNSQLSFTPTAATFFVTVDCVAPEISAIINEVSVIENINKIAGIQQQVTGVNVGVEHVLVIGQLNSQTIRIKVGTLQGLSDVLDVVSTLVQTTIKFTPTTPGTWFQVEVDGNITEQATITFFGMAELAAAAELGITMDTPWTEDQLKEVHLIETPQGQSFYFTHPNVQTQKLVYDFTTDTFSTIADVNFIGPPVEWTGTNWPATGAYFQGRLWLGGAPGQRQTAWGSVSGSPEDFRIDDPITNEPTDATAFDVFMQEFGRIEWMLGTKNLLIGTELGEFILTSDTGVLTVNDTQVEKQSAFGSNNMQAMQVGEKVFYMTPDGRKLRGMSYQWEEDNWLSQDLTFISEHITKGIGLYSTWAQHPNNFFFLSMADGTIAAFTYDRTAQTTGWSHLTLPGMKVLDLASALKEGASQLVLVGQRVPGFIDIETATEGAQFLDSYVITDTPLTTQTPTNIVTGLDHLEGKTVLSLVDGAVDVPRVVVNGQITTQNSGLRIITGIPYTSTIKTLTQDEDKGGNQIRSFKKRWNKVWALMLDSKAPIINGVRPPDRTPSTLMDTVEPNSSGHFKTVNLGWDDFGQITIEQDLPVAMFILAIYGEIGVETL